MRKEKLGSIKYPHLIAVKMAEDPAVTRFREYLRIKSVHPNPDYDGCIEFVKSQAAEIGLEFHYVKLNPPAETVAWATWRGSDPQAKSIMLNSHMDVVPVDESKWKYDPFAAVKDSDGNIYARGTQDMKSLGAQYLEAVRRLKKNGFVPRRDIHITFVPDEELGSAKGMVEFIKTAEFRSLNVGLSLDEAGACPDDRFLFFNGERALWQVRITVKGNTGHAVHFIKNTAAEKARKIINAFLDLRDAEERKLGVGPEAAANLGNVTTVNFTMCQGGVQPNVIPPEIVLTFDLRITPLWSQTDAENFISSTCAQAGSDITYEFILKGPVIPETPLTPDNKWWTAFKAGCTELDIKLLTLICPGATDARFIRSLGIPAFGFSPMNNTPILLHDNNEFVNESVFLRGVEIYETLLRNLSHVTE